MSPDHPWRRLRSLAHVVVVWRRMPGLLGATDGERVIVMHPDQLQVQRRCTLAHELAHIELGHTGGCSAADEAAAAELAARRLIPLDALVDAIRWSLSLEEAAEELWVDVDTLRTRVDTLTARERGLLYRLRDETELGC